MRRMVADYWCEQGIVNADGEILKAEKKRALAQSTVEKLNKQIASPEYTFKIPEKIQIENVARVRSLPSPSLRGLM